MCLIDSNVTLITYGVLTSVGLKDMNSSSNSSSASLSVMGFLMSYPHMQSRTFLSAYGFPPCIAAMMESLVAKASVAAASACR